MNEEIKQQWITALESDEYEQGEKRLRTNDNKYCCLGVLCDLAVKQGVAQWGKRKGDNTWTIAPIDEDIDESGDVGFGLLPQFIRVWSGINTDDGAFMADDSKRLSLTELNDTRKYNFSQIAEVIKDKL